VPYRAGAAYASVLPDFRGFHEKIGAEFAKIEPAAAKSGEKSGTAFARAFDDRMRLAKASIRVDADTANAERKIDEAARSRKVKLTLDTSLLKSPLALGALGGIALGPQVLGAGLGAAGLGAGSGAGVAGLLGFAAIAKPMITAVTTAQQNLVKAQLAYNKAAEDKKLATTKAQSLAASKAEAKALLAQKQALQALSPAERQLAAELAGVEKAWKRVQLAEQPAVGRAILPWLQTARQDAGLLKAPITDVSNAVGLLGNEARAALSSPFWSRFSRTFGTTGEIAVQTFGEAAGKVADGLAHLFTTFAPDIDNLLPLVDKAAGGFDRWASSVHRSGLEAFFKKTFSHGSLATLKGDLKALGTTLGNVASATSQLSPSAFLDLSKVLTILSKLTPDQITAIGALYGVSKLTGGLPGSLLAKGAGTLGKAALGSLLGSAVAQAVAGAVKTALAKSLATIGLKGLAGKIAGKGVSSVASAGEDVVIEQAGAEIVTAITGLGIDIDTALTALGADLDVTIGAAAASVVSALAVSKGIDIIGKLAPKIPGIGSLFSKISAPTVTVKVKVGKVSWKPLTASFARDVESPVAGWFASLAGQAAKAGASAGRALARGIGSQRKPAASAGSSIFGAVKAAFDPRVLFATGEKIIDSLISGLESKFPTVEGVLHRLTSLLPSWKGPAPVDAVLLTPAGITIMKSLAAGLDKGYSIVKGTLQKVAPKIASQLASDIRQLNARIAAGGPGLPPGAGIVAQFAAGAEKQLERLAYQYNQVTAKIAAAKQFAAQTASNTTSTFGIGAAGTPGANGKTTIGSIQANLTSYLHKIRAFGHNLSVLGQRGLNKGYIKELATLGPDQGGPIAAALATATDAQLGQVNAAEFQISKSAGQLGKLSANLIYDSGADFGKTLLSGLRGQKKALAQEFRELAKVLAIALATELHLPGVTMPVRGGGGVALRLVYDGPSSGPVKALMQDMRAEIIYTAGGDVQKALGRGKART
jgi:hypothetical protein